MPKNHLSSLQFENGTKYEFYDDTVVSSNDFVSSLYHFTIRGDIHDRTGLVIESAVIKADSFREAVTCFEATLHVTVGETYLVEFIGHDNRESRTPECICFKATHV